MSTPSKAVTPPLAFDWLNKTQIHFITKISMTIIKRVMDSNHEHIPSKNLDIRTVAYHAPQAMKYLYMDAFGVGEEDVLDERQTRAALNVEQKRTAEIRNEILLRKLVHADELKDHWCDILMKVKMKLLAMPVSIATQCVSIDSAKVLENVAKDIVHTALEELAVDMMPEISYETIDEAELNG